MLETEHSKGPWSIRDGSFIDAPSFNNLAQVRAAHVADQFEAKANARLIAAAPDMAETLRVLTDLVSNHWSGVRHITPREASDAVSAARSALAKAGLS
jgi:hypothetical protein